MKYAEFSASREKYNEISEYLDAAGMIEDSINYSKNLTFYDTRSSLLRKNGTAAFTETVFGESVAVIRKTEETENTEFLRTFPMGELLETRFNLASDKVKHPFSENALSDFLIPDAGIAALNAEPVFTVSGDAVMLFLRDEIINDTAKTVRLEFVENAFSVVATGDKTDAVDFRITLSSEHENNSAGLFRKISELLTDRFELKKTDSSCSLDAIGYEITEKAKSGLFDRKPQ